MTLAEVGRKFEEDTGVKVSVQYPESLEAKFQQVAATGGGPDIIFWLMTVLVATRNQACWPR